ncbi:hypothetical protein BS78_03G112500 [Paspalum vaginatum]|nr:hypothetical protein BS78_03G112500 [Paspalum vaginatum]
MAKLLTRATSDPAANYMRELVGAGDSRTALAIRQDTLYVTGFTDKQWNWYIFSNLPRRLIPRVPLLRRLRGPSWRLLEHLQAARRQADDAGCRRDHIANFVPRDDTDVGYVARALGIMAVTFSEASSFSTYQDQDLIRRNWESGRPAQRHRSTSVGSATSSSSGESSPARS